MWAYAIQIWCCAKPSQKHTIQMFQSIALWHVTSEPWYISNETLHNNLNIETVSQLPSKHYSRFHSKLSTHQNPKISSLSCKTLPGNPIRRLKQKWGRDSNKSTIKKYHVGFYQWMASLLIFFTSHLYILSSYFLIVLH